MSARQDAARPGGGDGAEAAGSPDADDGLERATLVLRALARHDATRATTRAHALLTCARAGCQCPPVRLVEASITIGVADTAVRHAAVFPGVKAGHTAVAGAFADLLLAASLVRASARAGRHPPADGGPLIAAAQYAVPRLVREAALHTAGLLGGRIHEPGEAAERVRASALHLHTLTAHLRAAPDSQPAARPPRHRAGVGGAPGLELFAGARPDSGDDGLVCRCDAPGPPAGADGPGADGMLGLLDRVEAELASGHLVLPAVRRLCEESRALARETAALSGPGVPQRLRPLVDRHYQLIAAAAAVGVWRAATPDETFLADPAWLLVALTRIVGRLTRSAPELPAPVVRRVAAEARRRAAQGRSLDLDGDPVR